MTYISFIYAVLSIIIFDLKRITLLLLNFLFFDKIINLIYILNFFLTFDYVFKPTFDVL